MKIAFIFVLYKTPEREIRRLKMEVGRLNLNDYKIYFIDNTENNKGYAAGINKGIKRALIDNPVPVQSTVQGHEPISNLVHGCKLLIVGNPDISLKGVNKKNILAGGEYFDVWGFAMKMHGKSYFGGEIDKIRLSGGLIDKKPKERFVTRDFVSGSLMCIKTDVVKKIGFFDEKYVMYYEDVDYCLRSSSAGFTVGIDSKIEYDHFETSVSNSDKELLLSSSRKKFFHKYANFWQKIYEFFRFWSRYAPQNDINSGGFVVNFFSLNLSSFINKVLNFFLFIFLIRYLKPNEYGIYALVWAQISLFSPIVDLGTTSYGLVHLPTEKKDKFVSMFNLRFAVSLLVFFLTILAGFTIFRNNSRIIGYIFLTSFVIFSNMLSGSYLIKNALEGRLFNSSLISIIFNTLLISSLSFSLIVFQSLPIIFILLFVFYNLYSFLNYFLIRKDLNNFSFEIDFTAWTDLIRKSYVFILISFFAGLYFKLDVFLLQILKGESAVGIYSAGYKFFEALMFIAASYNVARTPILARLIKKGRVVFIDTIKKDIFFLATIGFSISLFTFFISPIVLPIFLKGNYLESISVARLVMFALPFILVSSVFLNALYVLKKAKYVIGIFLTQTLLNFALNVLFIPKYSYVASSYITVFSEMLNLGMLLLTFYYIKKKYYEDIA